MNEFSPYHHLIDLRDFLAKESSAIISLMPDASTWESPHYVDVIFEHILQLVAKWATGITTTIIRQGVLNELRTARSNEHVKPDASSSSVLHGEIKKVGIYRDQDAAVIYIQQQGYEYVVAAAVHGSLLPFREQFLVEGRKIHFANIHFSNDHLIPNQFCIIDLRRSRSDIAFVMESSRSTSLKQLDPAPHALLLRIEGPTSTGITVSQGPTDSAELVLEAEQLGLQGLLRFGDIILLHRPWVREITAGILSLVYGPNTVMFRVPVELNSSDPLSQVSQHQRKLSQDGLRFRNSAACRSVSGTVDRVEHGFDSSGWTWSTLHLCEPKGHSVKISVQLSDCSRELRRDLGRVRRSHFLWLFGLIERSTNVLYFTRETALYNPSILHGVVASDIVSPAPLEFIDRFDTFVARAVVTEANCRLEEAHRTCGAVVSRGRICPICKCNATGNCVEALVLALSIDDGSADSVGVAAMGEQCPFWSGTPEKWKRAGKTEKAEMFH
jgi:hypothetical protein